jgi:hypothetical protein
MFISHHHAQLLTFPLCFSDASIPHSTFRNIVMQRFRDQVSLSFLRFPSLHIVLFFAKT